MEVLRRGLSTRDVEDALRDETGRAFAVAHGNDLRPDVNVAPCELSPGSRIRVFYSCR